MLSYRAWPSRRHRDSQGDLKFFSSISRDITRRRELEEQIAKAIRDLGRLFFIEPVPFTEKRFNLLTRRETEVVTAMLKGGRINSIASSFNIAPNTVRNHLKSIFKKLGVRSQAELVQNFKRLSRIGI